MLIGREHELELLTSLVADRGPGRRGVAVVQGSVGSGKSALLHAFVHALDGSALLLTATGSRSEQDLAFGVVDQMFRHPDMPPEVGDQVDRLHAEPPQGTSLSWSQFRVMDELCATLLAAAEQRSVVLVVDDAHLADLVSQQALQFVHRRLRFRAVTLVIAELADPDQMPSDFRSEITRSCGTAVVDLAPLSGNAVARWVRSIGRRPEASAPALHAATGGSPMLVSALLADAARETPSAASPTPFAGPQPGLSRCPARAEEISGGPAFSRSVLVCLSRLGQHALSIAQSVAVFGMGRPGGCLENVPVLVGKHTGLDQGHVTHMLTRMEEAGLLEDCDFRHPAARDATLRTIPHAEIAYRCHSAAAVLFFGGAPHAVVAAVLHRLHRVHEDWAVRVLRAAAADDACAGRIDMAIHGLGICARSAADPAQVADLTMQMMRLEWRRDPVAAERYLDALLQAQAADLIPPTVAAELGHMLLWYGRVDDLDCGTQASCVAAPVPWLCLLSPRHADAEQPARTPSSLVGGAGRALVGDLVGGVATARAVAAAERFVQGMRFDDGAVDDLFAALTVLLNADHADRVGEICDALLGGGCLDHAPTWRALVLMVRAEGALRTGDLTSALAATTTALEVLPAEGWGVVLGGLLATAVTVATAMGEYDTAAEHLRVPVPDAMFETLFGLQYLMAMGHHELALGHADVALGLFHCCGETMEGWGTDLPGLVPWRSGAAQALLVLGRREDARRDARTQLDRAGATGPRTRGIALRCLAATLPASQRFPLLNEAVELLHESGDCLTLAGALLDLSQAHQLADDEDKAHVVARRALRLARECNAAPLTRDPRLAERAAPLVVPPRRGAEHCLLSDAENRVAQLAAQGCTNREISARLFITVSTVEQHLTRIYRKLNVTRRVDLRSQMPMALSGTA